MGYNTTILVDSLDRLGYMKMYAALKTSHETLVRLGLQHLADKLLDDWSIAITKHEC